MKAPDDITGLCIWLDADNIAGKVQGNTVTSWADATANGNDAAEATNPPTYDDGLNFPEGAPGLLFDAVAERLTIAADASHDNSQATYIVIARLLDMREPAGNAYLLNKRNADPSTVSIVFTDQTTSKWTAWCRLAGSTATVRELANSGEYDGTMTMHVVRAKSGSQKYQMASLHGPLNLLAEQTTAANLDTAGTNDITIGRHPTTNNTEDRDRIIYQVIAFNNYISDADLDELVEWFQTTKYTNRWREQAQMFGTDGIYGVGIWVSGSTAYLTYVETDNVSVGYKTASLSDPHNWTDHGTIFTTASNCRKARLVKVGSTWFLFYDDRNGFIRVATGASPAALVDYGSNPILSGTGTGWEQYVRHPFVLAPGETHDGGWHMLYDGRQDLGSPGGAVSGFGAVGHATSSDGLTWTRDTANNPVLSPTGVAGDGDADDCAEPSAWWDAANSVYRVFWAGYRGDPYTHHMYEGESSDLTAVTRPYSGSNACQILPLSPDDTNDFNSESLDSPAVYPTGDGDLSMYYTAFNRATSFRVYRALWEGAGPTNAARRRQTVSSF